MDETDQQYRARVIRETIAKAAEHDITLQPSDFTLCDGDVLLDGMDPFDWIHAMTMD